VKRFYLVSFQLLLYAGLVICHLSSFTASPAQNDRNRNEGTANLIVPGEGVGPLHLGDAESKFFELFPDGPNKDLRPTYNPDCGTQLHWVDLDESHPLSLGVIVLSHKGTITQIEAGTPRFRTQDGITWGSSPNDVKKHYPGLKAYEAIGTTSEAVGGRNLIFWMDEKKGLGFVFAYSRRTKDWSTYKIVVFSPSGLFCPEANVRTPDTWRKLAPYSLEAPDHRASLRGWEPQVLP
jgi:hypothetical protein